VRVRPVTGWEIRQALGVILSHDDQVVKTGLTWLPAADVARLERLCRELNQGS
jgi:hypothetical protein